MKNRFGQQTLSGEVNKVTDSAVLFITVDGSEFWVPRSVCLDGQAIDVGDTDIVVASWWLEQEGHG